MSNEQMTPQPTNSHREIAEEIVKAEDIYVSELDKSSLVGGGISARICAVEKLLAEHFPDPQPTTERPTEPGYYWFKSKESWPLICRVRHDIQTHNIEVFFLESRTTAWVAEIVGEWTPIMEPTSPAEKGE